MEVFQTALGCGTSDRQQGKGEASCHHQEDDVRAERALGEDQPQLDPGEDQEAEAQEPGNQSEKQQAASHESTDPSDRGARVGILGSR